MSMQVVEQEILRFFELEECQAICLRGKWGVGKTYNWRKYLDRAIKSEKIRPNRYAYISLFGVNSLNELKSAIFENTVPLEQAVSGPSLASWRATLQTLEAGTRKLTWLTRMASYLQPYFGGVSSLVFFAVRNQIVCFDDIERKGKNLEVGDVFGLASFLKEQRACKIVFLLNEDALDDAAKEQFFKYLEKVVDVSLKFEPSPQDAAAAILKGMETKDIITHYCVSLKILNMRIIKKIEDAVLRIRPLLQGFGDEIFKQAVQTIVLWSSVVFEPSTAPSREYLLKIRGKGLSGSREGAQVPPEQVAWDAQLDLYGFSRVDEFDLALLAGIENGYFDPELVKKQGRELHQKNEAAKSNASFEEAWKAYHDSFDDNKDAVLERLHESFMRNVGTIAPINLDGTVRLFKELGQPERVPELIRH